MDRSLVAPYLRPLSPKPTGLTPEGYLQAPVKCLLCDIYGTLFISASGDIGSSASADQTSGSIDRLLERYGQPFTADHVQRERFRTIQRLHDASRSQGVDYPEVVIENVWQMILNIDDASQLRRFAVEFEMITNPVWPMPGLSALLDRCRAGSMLLGIISNAQFFTPCLFEWLLRATPAELGFDSGLCWYSYRHGCAKPSPTLFRMARNALAERGIEPHQVAFVGNDMRNDILPARQVGFQTVLFAGDSRSLRLRADDPACRDITPDLVVCSLEQLLSHLNDSQPASSPFDSHHKH
jgi:putative hydrolase of the HAD superfamily